MISSRMGPGAMQAGAVRSQGLHELRETELGQLRRFWGDPRRFARSPRRQKVNKQSGARPDDAVRSRGLQKYRRTGGSGWLRR